MHANTVRRRERARDVREYAGRALADGAGVVGATRQPHHVFGQHFLFGCPGSTRTQAASGNREVSSPALTITGLPRPISRIAIPEVSPAIG